MEIMYPVKPDEVQVFASGECHIFTLYSQLFTLSTKKALRPNDFWDERPAFRGTTRIRIL